MRAHHLLTIACLSSALVFNSCKEKHVSTKEDKEEAAAEKEKKQIDDLNHQYPKVPDERILDNGGNTPLYNELKERYKQHLALLQKDVAAVGAKFVVVIITTGAGKPQAPSTIYGTPFIKSACSDLGIECVDLGPAIWASDMKVITQIPRDGHWSKKGAEFLANQLSPIIRKHSGDPRSTVTYKDSERPETFGDLPPKDDEVLDGGKDMPYHVVANAQGCRMSHDIKFPKKKKHILFLGDSQIYSPFLDNEFITTALLEKEFPDAEMINTGMISWSVDDCESLFEEKAKFCEPDLVIFQTNGADITDLFFTHQNHTSRIAKPRLPSALEEKYYSENLAVH